jgi:hypothetical protein
MRQGLQEGAEDDREDDRQSPPDAQVLGLLPRSCAIRWLSTRDVHGSTYGPHDTYQP